MVRRLGRQNWRKSFAPAAFDPLAPYRRIQSSRLASGTLMPVDPATYIRDRIRSVPDWPRPGIVFRDITPLLQDRRTFRVLIDLFVQHYIEHEFDLVAGIDARGFILGSVVAYELNRGFIPVRKKGKLPFETVAEEYALEY